jgi:hypothetical protein
MQSKPNVSFVAGMSSLFAAAYTYLHIFILPATPILSGGDQWLFAQSGARIVAGQLPYRDFLEMLAPGTDLLYAALFSLFGQLVVIENALTLTIGVILAWLVARISHSVLDGKLAFTAVLLVLLISFRYAMGANHHWFSALWALAAIASVIESRSLLRIAIAGAFCGVSSCFTQTRGLAVVVGLAAFFWWESSTTGLRRSMLWKRPLVLLTAYAAVVSLVLCYFLATIGPYQVFASIVLFPAKYYGAYNHFDYWPVEEWRISTVTQLPAIAAAVILRALPATYLLLPFTIRHLRTCEATLRAKVVLVGFVGAALFLEVINAPSGPRLAVTAIPACILAVWLLNLHGFLSKKCLNAGAILLLSFATVDTIAIQKAELGVLDLPTGRVAFVKRDWYEDCRYLAAHTSARDWYFGDDWLGFPLGLRNPAFIPYVTNTDLTRPEQVQDLVYSLERHRVAYLSFSWVSDDTKPGPPGQDHLQPLRDYVLAHYQPAYRDFWRRTR